MAGWRVTLDHSAYRGVLEADRSAEPHTPLGDHVEEQGEGPRVFGPEEELQNGFAGVPQRLFQHQPEDGERVHRVPVRVLLWVFGLVIGE